jgi:hypothetical protein
VKFEVTQAVPLFRLLITYFKKAIEECAPLTRIEKYVLVRDATFFEVDFFTGDRASDLGRT